MLRRVWDFWNSSTSVVLQLRFKVRNGRSAAVLLCRRCGRRSGSLIPAENRRQERSRSGSKLFEKSLDNCNMSVGFLSQMMYALSPTAQDIVAGSSDAAKLHRKSINNLPSDRERLIGKI